MLKIKCKGADRIFEGKDLNELVLNMKRYDIHRPKKIISYMCRVSQRAEKLLSVQIACDSVERFINSLCNNDMVEFVTEGEDTK